MGAHPRKPRDYRREGLEVRKVDGVLQLFQRLPEFLAEPRLAAHNRRQGMLLDFGQRKTSWKSRIKLTTRSASRRSLDSAIRDKRDT